MSSTNPSVQSMEAIDLTNRTKLIMRDQLAKEGSCWACGETETQVSLILFEDIFSMYKAQGLLKTVTQLDHLDNLILLCHICHSLYNRNIPRLIILPHNLDFFISWEIEDYKRREHVVKVEGLNDPGRTVPSAADYDRECDIFLLKETFRLPSLLRQGHSRKKCAASPTALILKAGLAMGIPALLPPPLGFPAERRSKLTELLNLWQRSPLTSNSSDTPQIGSVIVTNADIIPSTIPPKSRKRLREDHQSQDEPSEGLDNVVFGPEMSTSQILSSLGIYHQS